MRWQEADNQVSLCRWNWSSSFMINRTLITRSWSLGGLVDIAEMSYTIPYRNPIPIKGIPMFRSTAFPGAVLRRDSQRSVVDLL